MREIALKLDEKTQKVMIIDKETGELLGCQTETIITSTVDGLTIAQVTFNIVGDYSHDT